VDSDDTLKPVPVGLEELAEALEGDPLSSGGILNLDAGEVFPSSLSSTRARRRASTCTRRSRTR